MWCARGVVGLLVDGHDLGLPDDYSGPCSELMSGGGPGTSCTNSYPDSTEISEAAIGRAAKSAPGGSAPANTMYFLNTDYIFFRPHASRNMVPIGDDRYAVNQDAMVKLIGFAGNMTTSNRFLQGILAA